MDIVILCPLAIEYHHVRQHLFDLQTYISEKDSALYELGKYQGKHKEYDVAIRQIGKSNEVIAMATVQAIQSFNPVFVFLVGVAGGVKDVKIGDVVIATKAYGYESGKETKKGFLSRPDVKEFSPRLVDQARHIVHRKGKGSSFPYQIIFGPIASGNKVIASKQEIYNHIKRNYNDTNALEMESIGFAKAVNNYNSVHGINIRGISDLLSNKAKSDALGNQAVAAEHAAQVTFKLLDNIKLTNFTDNRKQVHSKSNLALNSKNVIQGSNIIVKGDFHLGDKH